MGIQMRTSSHKNLTEPQCRTQLQCFQKLSRSKQRIRRRKQGALQNYQNGSFEDGVTKCYCIKLKPHYTTHKWLYNAACGRSDVTRTRDIHIPNVARYQLRYTPNNIIKFLPKEIKNF